MPHAGMSTLLQSIQSSCSSPVGDVWVTSLSGLLIWPPLTKSMGKSSGSKFQSPRIKICRLPKAATAAKISKQTSRLSHHQRGEDGGPIVQAPSACPSPCVEEAALACTAAPDPHWVSPRSSEQG
eukprot:5597213-Amphidinium_carterae.1